MVDVCPFIGLLTQVATMPFIRFPIQGVIWKGNALHYNKNPWGQHDP